MKKISILLVTVSMIALSGCNQNNLKADFEKSFTNSNHRAPASVNFINKSTGANSYTWNFGDGNNSSSQDATHIFATGGTFNIWLKAWNGSNVDSSSQSITIDPPYTGLQIITLIAVSFPATNGGNSWDVAGGSDPAGAPDPYLVLKNQSMAVLTQTTPVSNETSMAGGQVDFTLPNLTQVYTVEIYDEDGAADQLIGSATFNITTDVLSQENPYPAAVDISGSGVTISMNLQWL